MCQPGRPQVLVQRTGRTGVIGPHRLPWRQSLPSRVRVDVAAPDVYQDRLTTKRVPAVQGTERYQRTYSWLQATGNSPDASLLRRAALSRHSSLRPGAAIPHPHRVASDITVHYTSTYETQKHQVVNHFLSAGRSLVVPQCISRPRLLGR